MRKILALAIALCAVFGFAAVSASPAFAWGASGHSIVAEIGQRRLDRHAAREVQKLLGRGHSLASVASWADDVRTARPGSYNWHFVDIPVAESAYNAANECAANAAGDCVLAELDRLTHELRCAPDGVERAEALRFAVHFIGDLHQPLHTVAEARGGNDIAVTVDIHGLTCARCTPAPNNLHAVWDTTLIDRSVYDWGAYVDRLETGWLLSDEARSAHTGGPLDWALDSHAQAQRIWALTPADGVLNDAYYAQAQPILDRQLGLGGIHLADYLNAAFAHGCEERGFWSWLWRRRHAPEAH